MPAAPAARQPPVFPGEMRRTSQVEEIEAAAIGQTRIGGAIGMGIGDYLLKNRAEEDERWCGPSCGGDLAQGVAGDADHRRGQTRGGVKPADVRGRERAFGGGEVDAVGVGCDGDVGAGIDEQLRGRRVAVQGCD